MSSLDETELEALQDAFVEATPARASQQVEPRNFAQPRHLSAGRLQTLGRDLRRALDALVPELARVLRGNHELSLGGLSEIDAAGLLKGRTAPFLLHGFQCSGEQGWVAWDMAAAHCTAEAVITGSSEGLTGAPDKRLSRTEQRIVCELIDRVAGCCALALGLTYEAGTIGQDPDELITLGIAPPDRDGRRLAIHLCFEGPGGPSDLFVYLPGVHEERAAPAQSVADLPGHLDRVQVEVSACLGSIDIPLSQMLDLEEGDVIPLDAPEGTLVELFAEDRPCATATWGRFGDHLAVRVEHLDEEFKELHPDTE